MQTELYFLSQKQFERCLLFSGNPPTKSPNPVDYLRTPKNVRLTKSIYFSNFCGEITEQIKARR